MNVIIGAGPAGLQMAALLDNHIILEKSSSVCSFMKYFPRQRGLISINKSKDLRMDWNSFLEDTSSFRDYSEELYPRADDYVRYAEDFVQRKNLNIRFNYAVNSIRYENSKFIINDGEYVADKVFFGTGLVPREPDVKVHPSIQMFTYQNMPLDKEIYRDKNVIIVGSGNAALETADWIAPMTKFTLICGQNKNAWYTHYPGHARSKNYTSIDSFFLKAGSFTVFSANETEYFKDTIDYKLIKEYLENAKSDIIHKVDIVIFCIGFTFNSELVKDLVDICPKTKFPLLTDEFESRKCPGLFFIGASSQAKDYKKGTSAFIHGFRYNCQYISRYLKGIEPEILSRDQLIKKVFWQMNKSSFLLHRFDYFCDVIEKLPDGTWKYTKEVPYPRETPKTGFTMRLGYTNTFPSQSFIQPSFIYPKDSNRCVFIHPIFNTTDKQFELPEDIYNEFSDKEWHIKPFMYFLEYVEGSKTLPELRGDIAKLAERRGGRDLFFMDGV